MCLNPAFRWGPNFSFFGLGPWGLAKIDMNLMMIPFERSLSSFQKIGFAVMAAMAVMAQD